MTEKGHRKQTMAMAVTGSCRQKPHDKPTKLYSIRYIYRSDFIVVRFCRGIFFLDRIIAIVMVSFIRS